MDQIKTELDNFLELVADHCATTKAVRYVGGVGSGKTTALLGDVAALLEFGISPDDIIVFCASPSAADVFRTKAKETLSVCPETTTVREWALEALADAELESSSGRQLRLLTYPELELLMEDMKTSGLKMQRLKEMLKFFYRSLTELADQDKEWLVTAEEKGVYSLLQGILSSQEAILEPKLSNYVVSAFVENEKLLARFRYDHVFVDDFHAMNRASQVLTAVLAHESIVITGCEIESSQVYETYPYTAGLDEFVERFKEVTTRYLEVEPRDVRYDQAVQHESPKINEWRSNLSEQEQIEIKRVTERLNASPSFFSVVETKTPIDEFESVARIVDQLLLRDDVSPADIFIVSPCETWLQDLSETLSHNHRIDLLPHVKTLDGNIYEQTESGLLRAYFMLNLIADPYNLSAWRGWCGLGDHLGQSTFFSTLREHAEKTGRPYRDIFEALLSHANPPIKIPPAISVALQSGLSLIETYREDDLGSKSKKTGEQLLACIAREVDPENEATLIATLSQLCRPNRGDTATVLCERIHHGFVSARFMNDETSIKLGEFKDLCGQSPRHLIISGFMNGFIPVVDYFDGTITTLDQQKAIFSKDMRILYSSFGKAQESLTVTYATRLSFDDVFKYQAKVDRIKLEKRMKVHVTTPSLYLEVFKTYP